MTARRITGWILVLIGVAVLALKLGHIYDPAPAITKLSAKAGPGVANFVRSTTPDMVVYVMLVGLPACIGGLLLAATGRVTLSPKRSETALGTSVSRGRRAHGARVVHSANVLQVGPHARHIWQF